MRNIFLTISFIVASFFAMAQDAMREGDAFFDEENYKAALEQYLKALKSNENDVTLRNNIGICYLNLNLDRSQAIPHLEWVVKQEKFDDYAWFDLAHAYHFDHQFDKAIEHYRKYKAKGNDEEFIQLAQLGIQQCENAKVLVNKAIDVTFHNVGDLINTENNEFQPYIPPDESTLVFTSDEKYDSRYKIHTNNVYITEREDGKWGRPKMLGVVNSQEDEFVSGLAANDSYLFVKFQRYEAYDDIFMAEKSGTRIGRPVGLGDNINSKDIESGATLSPTGDTLYFASNRDGGLGGMDIWMAISLPDGSWGTPVNLGEPVNTKYDEDFPHIMGDGETFFFSSTGHNSMGGYDVFRTKLNAKTGKFAAPRNFGYPVNNTYDNFTIAMSSNFRYAYVSDVRKEGYGGMDIYRVVFNNVEANVFLHIGSFSVPEGASLNIAAEADVTIEVTNKETGEIQGKYKYDVSKNEFLMALPPGLYSASVKLDGYQAVNKDIFVPDLLPNKIFRLIIALQAE
jgi:predicted negative regulator of RcsB-dependent stress response